MKHRIVMLLLVVCLGLLLAWPLLARPGLPRATDAELHIYRTAEMGYSLRAGEFYPRWAPDYYYGYGYPIFNYYAPFTYHLGSWLTLLQPERAVAGTKGVLLLAYILGGVGAYLLGKEYGGARGGFLSATVFLCSPYILLINSHIRGDVPEVFAVALLPLTLWFWERLWRGGGRWILLGAVLSACIVFCSHNLTALTMLGLLIGLGLWHWLILGQKQQFKWGVLAGLLLAALTAFFWLPFLLERGYVKLDVIGSAHYDFRNHFVPLRTLLALLPPLDWGATTPQLPNTVGPLGLIVALAGGGLLWHAPEQRRRSFFYVLSTILLFFIITPYSASIWEHAPGLAYFQFPWRFLGPLAAVIAPLAAGLERLRTRWIVWGATGLLLFAALPGLYPPLWEAEFGDVSPTGMIAFELEGWARGTTSTDDFLPTTVTVIPAPAQPLLQSYWRQQLWGSPLARIYGVPADATAQLLEQGPTLNRYFVETPEAFILRFYLFDFPGWQAYLDGIPVPIELAHPEGWITVPIPAGSHEVLVRFEDTPPRQVGWLIAALGVGGLLLTLWFYRPPLQPQTYLEEAIAPRAVYTALALLLAFASFKVGIADHTRWFHYRSAPGEARPAHYPLHADFGGEIALLGFDLVPQTAHPGETVEVTLYWAAQVPPAQNYQVFVHLVRPEGQVWAQSDHLNPGGFPTMRWPLDQYVWDQHRLVLPPELPPGEYEISVGLYLLHTRERLPVRAADSGARQDNIILSRPLRVR